MDSAKHRTIISMAGSGQQFYEEDDAEQILRMAASMSSPMGSMSRDRLMATAAELGITPEAVEQAEQQLRSQRAIESERAEFDALKKREFFGHLISYVLVNLFLVAVNLLTSLAIFGRSGRFSDGVSVSDFTWLKPSSRTAKATKRSSKNGDTSAASKLQAQPLPRSTSEIQKPLSSRTYTDPSMPDTSRTKLPPSRV